MGPEPEGADIAEQGFDWTSSYRSGKGGDTITSGLEGAWTPTPTAWDNSFLETLFGYNWDLPKSPAGVWQWVPAELERRGCGSSNAQARGCACSGEWGSSVRGGAR